MVRAAPWMVLLALLLVGCGGERPTVRQTSPETVRHGRDRQPTAKARKRPEPQGRATRRSRGYRSHPQVAARCEQVLPAARRIAEEHQLDLGLLMAIARTESRYDHRARNRRSGAAGLMQVMPITARHFRCGDLYDLEENLVCGARVLKRYLEYFDGDPIYGVSAYHAGIVSPKRARKAGRLPKNLHYVERVMQVRSRFTREGCH